MKRLLLLAASFGSLLPGLAQISLTNLPGDVFPPTTPTLVRAHPVVASNGRDYLVVWEEIQRLPYFSQSGDPVTVRAARVRGSDGTVLDLTPIALPASWSSASPAVASDGQDFLIVWQDFTKDRSPVGLPCQFESDVFGARVRARDGAVLDATAMVISAHDRGQGTPAVAFGRNTYLVVWKDSRASDCAETDLYGARVNPRNGRVYDRNAFPISQMPGSEEAAAVAFDGRDYLVAWDIFESAPNVGTHIFCARVAGESVRVLGRPAIPLCQTPGWHFNPRIACAGGLFWLAWEGFPDDNAYAYAQGDVYLARLLAIGSRVFFDAGGFPAVVGSTAQLGPRLASRGRDVLLAWQSHDIYGVRVPERQLGQDLDAFKFRITPGAENPTGEPYNAHVGLAASARHFLSAWVQNGNIFATRLHGVTLQPVDMPPVQVSR